MLTTIRRVLLGVALAAATAPSSASASGSAGVTAGPLPNTSASIVTVKAVVVRADPTEGPGLNTLVTWRIAGSGHGVPRTLTRRLPGGARGETRFVVDRWPLWRTGMRVRASFGKSAGRWGLLRATEIGHRPRWAQLGGSVWPAHRMPMVWHVAPDTPGWAQSAAEVAAWWWEGDPGSWLEFAQEGARETPDISDCGASWGSWVAVRPLRAQYGGAVGLGGYCADGEGAYSWHIWLDPDTSDYSPDSAAAHEIGHGLGFDHSGDAAAIMYPVNHPASGLGADDIAGLRTLYPGAFAFDLAIPSSVGGQRTVRVNPGQTTSVGIDGHVIGGNCDPGQMGIGLSGDRAWVTGTTASGAKDRLTVATHPQAADMCVAALSFAVPDQAAGSTAVTLEPISPDGSRLSGRGAQVIVDVNKAPAVTISGPSSALVGQSLSFSANATDPDGDSLTFAWDLDGDGAYDDATGSSVSTAFPAAGSRTVAVRVTDALALTSQATKTVSVTQPASGTGTATGTSTSGSTGTGSGTSSGSVGGGWADGPSDRSPSTVRRLRILGLRVSGRRLEVRLQKPTGQSVQCSLVRKTSPGQVRSYWTKCWAISIYSDLRPGTYVFRARTRTQRTTARVIRIR